ncbi:MAG: hypothetical protein EOP94_03115 [Zymomonas sp.]|nr:MAG: hypothetical protein EOP94_03115 [Zymomonas sp.]
MPVIAGPAPQSLRPATARSVPASMQKALRAQADHLGTRIGGRIGIAVRLLETGEIAVANIER